MMSMRKIIYCVGRTKSAHFLDHYSIYLTSMEVTMMLIMNFITIHNNCVMKTKEHSKKKKKILTIEQSWKMENWSKVVMAVAFCLLCYR